MVRKQILAIVVGLGLIILGAMKPAPAQAEDALIIAGAAVGAYLLFVVVGTMLVYGGGPLEFDQTSAPLPEDPAQKDAVQVGVHCPPVDGQIPLFCW